MAEKYTNNAVTTLNGTITNVATSLIVTSATGFPTSGYFRIKIDSEIILVTAVSGTTFTITRGQEGTTAAGHNTGATVSHILTAASLKAVTIETDSIDLTTDSIIKAKAIGESYNRFEISPSGYLYWGQSGGTRASLEASNGAFYIRPANNSSFHYGGFYNQGEVQSLVSNTGQFFLAADAGGNNATIIVRKNTHGGYITLGLEPAISDTGYVNIYRASGQMLKTDQSFISGGDIIASGTVFIGNMDTAIYRPAASHLKTDDSVTITNALSVSGTVYIGADTNLYRSAANTLKTDDSLVAGATSANKDQITIPDTTAGAGLTIGADTNLYRSAANTLKTDDLFVAGATSSAYNQITIPDTTAGAGILIGADTNLFRAAANHLKTEDGFTSTGDLSVSGTLFLGADTSIYRPAVNHLKTEDALTITSNLSVSGTIFIADDVSIFRAAANHVKTDDAVTATSNVSVSGTIFIGADTNIYRSAANNLKTDDNFQAVGMDVVGGGSLTIQSLASASTDAITTFVTGDTIGRLVIDADGTHNWGPGGASAIDTNLYRVGASHLKTDDNLTVVGNVTVSGSITGINPVTRVYTVTGSPHTWTKPTGLTHIIVEAVGAGGAGGGAQAAASGANSKGGGGGGGAYSRRLILAASLGGTETVTVGAKGAGVSAANGGNGGNTSFGTLVTASGGFGGIYAASSTATFFAARGGDGGLAPGTADYSIPGAQGHMGAGGAGLGIGGAGAPGPWGGGGLAVTFGAANNGQAGNAASATAYGAGGGGAITTSTHVTAYAGGAGGDGVVIVHEFYAS